jgi:hypothetical protein
MELSVNWKVGPAPIVSYSKSDPYTLPRGYRVFGAKGPFIIPETGPPWSVQSKFDAEIIAAGM